MKYFVIGFIGTLTAVLITAKLSGANISWWWVWSPVWGYAILVAFLLIAVKILEVKVARDKRKRMSQQQALDNAMGKLSEQIGNLKKLHDGQAKHK